MKKTCVKLGLQECTTCKNNVYNLDLDCWVDLYRKTVKTKLTFKEIKSYLYEEISILNKTETYKYDINYIKAAIGLVCPEYLSFIDKILLLI